MKNIKNNLIIKGNMSIFKFYKVLNLRHNIDMEGEQMNNNIKNIRTEIGYKQYKVAEKLGISTRHYARLENGERKARVTELLALSTVFNCTVEELEGNNE